MARIFRHPNMLNPMGEPAYCLDYRDEHGRRKQTRTNASTMKDAERALRAVLSEIDKAKALGVPRQALSGVTFGAFVDQTYLPLIGQKIRGSTKEGYEAACRDLKDYFGAMVLGSIEPTTIDGYLEDRKKTLGAGTLKNRLHRLNAIFKKAQRKRVAQYSPCDGIERWTYQPKEKAALTPEQEEALMGELAEWVKPIVTWGLYGGMRESEIIKTEWRHVEGGFVHIPAENAKNGKPRAVPLSSEMEAAIAPLRARRLAEGSPSWVFYDAARRGPYTRRQVYHAYKAAAKRLKIESTFHCTRVTLITDARESGRIPDPVLGAIVGHSDGRMLAHYTKIRPEHLAGATEGLRRRKDAEQKQNDAAQG